MKRIAILGLVATQLISGFATAANLDVCEPLSSSMAANFLVLDKIFGLEKANQTADEFYAKFLAESKKVGLHTKAQELVQYRTARYKVIQMSYKSVSEFSESELAEYLQLKKSTAPELEFKLQEEVRDKLAVVIAAMKSEIANLTAKGYTFEVDTVFSGTVQFKKEIEASKAISYKTSGLTPAICSHSKSHTQVIMRYVAGDTKYTKHFDRPNTQGCNNVLMGSALLNLSQFPAPENCNTRELQLTFSTGELE